MKQKEFNRELYNIYTGILKNNEDFLAGSDAAIHYETDCPEYAELTAKYDLKRKAGRGTDFERAVRLMRHFAPRLTHKGDYDNHIERNSLALLEYCYEKPENGINCLNKAKILAECCMAVGIKARRIAIMPYSPYDFDNHVVTEIYDLKRKKWIMLDMTTGGYYIDEEREPLSCLEIRQKLAGQELCSIVLARQSMVDAKTLFERNLEDNAYYAKNMFYFIVDEYSSFGEKGDRFFIAPRYFDCQKAMINNLEYKLKASREKGLPPEALRRMETILEKWQQREICYTNIKSIWG